MKNYYELLEVSEKASPEVIKKAYTTLVKKYHPDLQPDSEKKTAEEKIKEINEAYEVLSDNIKRESYDNKLKSEKIKEEQAKYKQSNVNNNSYKTASKNNKANNTYNSQNNDSYYTKPEKKIIRKPNTNNNPYDYDNFDEFNNFQQDYNHIINEVYNNAYNEAYNNAYNQAYINNLRNMGYEIQYERPLKEKIKIFFSSILVILLLSFIFFILWHIPFIKKYFVELYNNNSIIQIIVDMLNKIIQSFLNLFK